MLFSLPWDLRARIWAAARFLAARHALAAHLPARARCRTRTFPFVAEARLSVAGRKVITVRRSVVCYNVYDHYYKVTRDLETVRVSLVATSCGLVVATVTAGETEEQWVQLQTTARWVHTHAALRPVAWPVLP